MLHFRLFSSLSLSCTMRKMKLSTTMDLKEEFLMLKKISLSQENPQIMTIPKRTIQREKMNLEETYQTKINRRSGKAGAADHAPGDEKS